MFFFYGISLQIWLYFMIFWVSIRQISGASHHQGRRLAIQMALTNPTRNTTTQEPASVPLKNPLWNATRSHFFCWTYSLVVVSNIFYFHPYLGKISHLTNIFQTGWNHQLDSHSCVGGIFSCFFWGGSVGFIKPVFSAMAIPWQFDGILLEMIFLGFVVVRCVKSVSVEVFFLKKNIQRDSKRKKLKVQVIYLFYLSRQISSRPVPTRPLGWSPQMVVWIVLGNPPPKRLRTISGSGISLQFAQIFV